MRTKRLEMLYRTLIKEHSANPKNRGKIEDPDGETELFNPSCGDLIQIQYRLTGNKIEEIVFDGQGCAISLASASLMTELMQGKTVKEAKSLISLFSELIQGNEAIEIKELGDAVFLQGVAKFPTRIRCANLSWTALEEALDKFEASQEEELENGK
ncbi:MAG: SUF system NifU family Fe-S cluster assembly protein [Atopostipes suicloacalis]|nr:SUF system NifU family Fe-S cluster assembly protein [Atopostipes suicloacalis]MDN6730647.1 SUF system NifU family Fe-S cluster assembly protein [Atopostipes suicloacalis]